MSENNGDAEQVVPGISISPTGQATVDSSLTNVLFDLAIKLEELTQLPVDVEHVLAAIVMAARQGELDSNTRLSSEDSASVAVLTNHVKTVFAEYDGKLGMDD
jgi:hypothetical protein